MKPFFKIFHIFFISEFADDIVNMCPLYFIQVSEYKYSRNKNKQGNKNNTLIFVTTFMY